MRRGALTAAGVGFVVLSVAMFLKSFQQCFYGWWGYLFKPAALVLCVIAPIASGIVMGHYPAPMQVDELLVGIFFCVFPAVTFLVLMFVPGRVRLPQAENATASANAPTNVSSPLPSPDAASPTRRAASRVRDYAVRWRSRAGWRDRRRRTPSAVGPG